MTAKMPPHRLIATEPYMVWSLAGGGDVAQVSGQPYLWCRRCRDVSPRVDGLDGMATFLRAHDGPACGEAVKGRKR